MAKKTEGIGHNGLYPGLDLFFAKSFFSLLPHKLCWSEKPLYLPPFSLLRKRMFRYLQRQLGLLANVYSFMTMLTLTQKVNSTYWDKNEVSRKILYLQPFLFRQEYCPSFCDKKHIWSQMHSHL